MKKWLLNKSIPKPAFLLIIVLLSISAFLYGGITFLKMGIHYGTVSGYSMEHTLTDGTKLLYINADLKKINRGDIIAMSASMDNEPCHFVKRVIALPNESIKIKGNKVYINGELLDEPYAYYSSESQCDLSLTVPEDGYFIMGDNRMDSLDSCDFGPISKKLIVQVVLKIRK